jgi:hypothetical protein
LTLSNYPSLSEFAIIKFFSYYEASSSSNSHSCLLTNSNLLGRKAIMPEPATVAAITGLVIKALELVRKRHGDRLSEQETKDLYCNIFSSLLFEVHQNLDRCRMFIENAMQNKIAGGVLSFFVRDALFSDFCIMCPEPEVVSSLNEIYSGFERMHHWQRVTTDLSSQTAGLIIGFAGAMFRRELHLKYNTLLGVLKELCPNTAAPPEFDPSTIPSEALES